MTSRCGLLRTELLRITLQHKVYNSHYNNSHISHAAAHNGQELKANIMPHISLVVCVLRRSVFSNRHCSVAVCFFCEGVFFVLVYYKKQTNKSQLRPLRSTIFLPNHKQPISTFSFFTTARHSATPQAGFIHPRDSTSKL